ncbi:MAG TPA: DUF362 domain-containing protein [Pantanalinema sp.]
MTAEVYFAQRRATGGGGLMDKIEQLLDAAGLAQVVTPGDRVAIKTHFGEPGNTTHIRPEILRRLIKKVRQADARPFVTDSNARYSPRRTEAVGHLEVASAHGFNYPTLGAPVLIADGVDGRQGTAYPTGGKHLGTVSIAGAIDEAEALIVANHVTFHPEVGFVGALYHLGLGALTREGKLALCAAPSPALVLAGGDSPSREVEAEAAVLPPDLLAARIAEAFGAVHRAKAGKILYCNVLMDLTPDPDGAGWSDAAVIPDVGILVSRDPVGLDQATADFLNMQTGLPGTCLQDLGTPDKIRSLAPAADWDHLLELVARDGLGSRDYELLII